MSSNSTNASDVGNNKWFSVAIYATSSITFTIGFPVNLAIIYLVSRRRNLKNPTNAFVSSLALADILVLVWMMIWIVCLHVWNDPSFMLQIYVNSALDMFLASASMTNVACVSADRAIAVVYPLRYESIITKKSSLVLILSVWVYSFSILSGALFRIAARNQAYNTIMLCAGFASFFVPATVIVVSYLIIFIVIVRKLKGIRIIEKAVSNASIRINENLTSTTSRRKHTKFFRELKVTGNVLLIVLPFTFSWAYFVGSHIHEAVTQTSIINDAHSLAIIVIPWVLSALNPIIYLLLNRSLRIAFFDTVKNFLKSGPCDMEETRLNFLLTNSRRASNSLRRSSENTNVNGVFKMFL